MGRASADEQEANQAAGCRDIPLEILKTAKAEYTKGALVFGLFKDKSFEEDRWYLAKVVGVDHGKGKFALEWCEDKKTDKLPPHFIMSQKAMLRKGLEVNILRRGKPLYDVAFVEEYIGDNDHVFKNKRGQVVKNFPVIESLMIRAPSLEEFRRKAAVEVSSEDAEELRSQQGGGSVKSSGDDADKAKLKGHPRKHSLTDKDSVTSNSRSPLRKRAREIQCSDVTSGAVASGAESDADVSGGKLLSGFSFMFSAGSSFDAMDRSVLAPVILDLGGKLCSSFNSLMKEEGTKILLAPQPVRTVKYFQCLAAAVPCVSYGWIEKLAKERKFSSFPNFRLAAGLSVHVGRTIAWKPRPVNLLKGKKFGLHALNAMDKVWKPILDAAEAEYMVLEYNNFLSGLITDDTGERNHQLFAILVEENGPPELLAASIKSKVPVVDSEWLLECLVHGQIILTTPDVS